MALFMIFLFFFVIPWNISRRGDFVIPPQKHFTPAQTQARTGVFLHIMLWFYPVDRVLLTVPLKLFMWTIMAVMWWPVGNGFF